MRFVMKDRNISVEDVFTETSVDHWKFNDSHLIFRFYGEEKEEGEPCMICIKIVSLLEDRWL